MPVDRPTFSESWYRVVELRPRLRSAVQIHRQHYRGQTWYVVQDPANNQFYRLPPPAYHLVGMLDGRRTVGQVWRACNEELGDAAPTQGEAIQLLGQLYAANLIHAELPPDAESMFRRFRQRKTREIRGYLTNLLFIRLPVFDPDAFLNRWVGVVGWVFSPAGAAIWAAMMCVGAYYVAGNFGELIAQSKAVRILSASNLPWLYVSMAFIKAFHEFGHAFACKRFGQKDGSGGEVHVMGIMFLVFTPLPYVDASSAWAFNSKWRRAMVGLAGMFVELFLAAIAAVVWAKVTPDTIAHTIAYNVVFIASVSTLLFNGNPLLRYDGYYILSDLLEIPNLWNRSREYLYYLVKRYVWGVRRARCPSQSGREKAWLLGYSIASTVYRFFIVFRILLYVASAIPLLGVVLATVAVAAWVMVPLGKFLHYLLASPELMRVRARAVVTTAMTLGAVVAAVGLLPVAEHVRADAIVRPQQRSVIYAGADGFLRSHLPSGSLVGPVEDQGGQEVLVRCENRQLELTRDGILAQKRRLQAEWRQEQRKGDLVKRDSLAREIQAVEKALAYVEAELSRLVIRAPHPGRWYAPQLDQAGGGYLKRGEPLGVLVNLDEPLIETVITQEEAARVLADVDDRVEFRLSGAPRGEPYTGKIIAKIPAGQKEMPSPIFGTPAGGQIPIDPSGRGRAAEPFFRVRIRPDAGHPLLRAGQKIAVRFDLPERPLAVRWYRSLLQLLQKRFGM